MAPQLFQLDRNSNGYKQVHLRTSGGSATICLLGGQVTSWKNKSGDELLFTSKKSTGKPPAFLRGGIYVCFPEFENVGLVERHGSARKHLWQVDHVRGLPAPDDCPSFVDLVFQPSAPDRKFFFGQSQRFDIVLRVGLTREGSLHLTSTIRNLNEYEEKQKGLEFSFGFRTYLSVSDISDVRVEGVDTHLYVDNLEKKKMGTQAETLTFESGSEVDRAFLDIEESINVFDHLKRKKFVIELSGLGDVGISNPGKKKSKEMVDFGNEEYKNMLCVDPATIQKKIKLKGKEEWSSKMKISFLDGGVSLGVKR